MPIRPVNVDLDRAVGELRINWSDERQCSYPLSHLREACPCVECRGGHEFMGRTHEPEHVLALQPARSYGVEGIELVGNYALQLTWDDGHDSGIYAWDYLYRLCPPTNALD
ncbi:gamma-butyrobetaine hydroxylase-like domain-containing protein [Chloroflexota bacterium]